MLVRTGEIADALPHRVRLQIGECRLIAWSSLDESKADLVIAEEIEHHRRLDAPFEWKCYAHDSPADLRERLQRAGFAVGPAETVLVYALSETPLDGRAFPHSDRVRVAPITRPEEVDDYRRVAERASGEPVHAGLLAELTAAVERGSTELRGYLAYVGDRAVGASRLYTHPQSWFAGLYGGGVDPEFRRQGVYRAMVAARAQAAREAGAKCLLVDALPTSRPILERLGFERLSETWPCEWSPRSSG